MADGRAATRRGQADRSVGLHQRGPAITHGSGTVLAYEVQGIEPDREDGAPTGVLPRRDANDRPHAPSSGPPVHPAASRVLRTSSSTSVQEKSRPSRTRTCPESRIASTTPGTPKRARRIGWEPASRRFSATSRGPRKRQEKLRPQG